MFDEDINDDIDEQYESDVIDDDVFLGDAAADAWEWAIDDDDVAF